MTALRLFSAEAIILIINLSGVIGAPIEAQEETSGVNDTIYYQLFTRKNPSEYQVLQLNDFEALQKSNYDPKNLVKLYAPGWDNNGSIGYPAKDEFLLREDCNVIIIDWRTAQPKNASVYIQPTTRTGIHTGAFIDFLIGYGTPRSAFHLIGHSCGTHLAGVAGSSVTSGKLPRITGLDPARTWSLDDTYNILDPSDADFVDIVHTNGGNDNSTDNDRAIFDPMGHVDFYANGGNHQPGCDDNHCNHLRTADLFTESINSKVGFRALECDTFEDYQKGLCNDNDVKFMGEHTPSSARGIYQFATNGESPFARG